MQRIVYRGTLEFPYGFHTGDGRQLGPVDQPLLRTFDGNLELAGTSLAGVLRADLYRLAESFSSEGTRCTERPDCKCPVCLLMGPYALKERLRTGEGFLRASRLHVRGGTAPKPSIRVRDRVGIDRRTRTAADQRKHDVEVAGSVAFPFELHLELRTEEKEDFEPSLELLELSLRRWTRGWLFLGGKTSTGLGRAQLKDLTRQTLDLCEPQQLVQSLLEDSSHSDKNTVGLDPEDEKDWRQRPSLDAQAGSSSEEEAVGAPASWAQLRIDYEVEFPFGILINDPAESVLSGFAHAFLRDEHGRPILPGSSLKGALRSRAEQILRTLGNAETACDLHTKGQACHEKIQQLENGRKKALPFKKELERMCLACRIFGSGRLASSLRVTDATVSDDQILCSPHGQDFVAIDRFTGGAAQGLKFDAQSSPTVTLRGELHLDLSPQRLQDWGLGLLLLVLRDWLEDDLPLGFGTAKGLNEHRVRFTSVSGWWVTPPESLEHLLESLPKPPEGLASPRLSFTAKEHGVPSSLTDLVPQETQGTLTGWVHALHSKIAQQPSHLGA